jgi:hypothetical protein
VFFLVGVLNTSGTANRDCSVPAGKALFFPILNIECDNVGVDPPRTVDELRQQCKAAIDGASNLSATLDGTPITGLASYRVQSPVFSVTFPDNNVFQALGLDVPAGTYTPFVSDGIFLMLKSLPAGAHTLHFGGAFPNFTLDITYRLNVAN